jgi:2-methylaconitate cis-trans-isomerase PrpF
VIEPGPLEDGIPIIRYAFAQVAPGIDALDRSVECGNIASGVPLFAAMEGWTPAPEAGLGLRMLLTNTDTRVEATWMSVVPNGGTVRLRFPGRANGTIDACLPLGEARSVHAGQPAIEYTVVRGLNTYLILRSEDLGVVDPLSMDGLEAGVFDRVSQILSELRERIGPGVVKVCLVGGSSSDHGAIRARIIYPAERRLHPSFAVTGATTLALGWSIPGSILDRGQPRDADFSLRIDHAAGALALACRLDEHGELRDVGLERSCRLIARGSLY